MSKAETFNGNKPWLNITNRTFRSMEKLQFVTNYRVPIEKDISQTIHHRLRQRQRLQHVQVTRRRYTCRATATVTTGVVTIRDLCDPRLVERALNWVNRT
jgi:hypothetical protein